MVEPIRIIGAGRMSLEGWAAIAKTLAIGRATGAPAELFSLQLGVQGPPASVGPPGDRPQRRLCEPRTACEWRRQSAYGPRYPTGRPGAPVAHGLDNQTTRTGKRSTKSSQVRFRGNQAPTPIRA
jgi:hypothetical protein